MLHTIPTRLRYFTVVLAMLISVISANALLGEDHWSAWRGPFGNGVADAAQKPPIEWSDSSNVIWKTEVPGRGHSSPVIFGNHIFLTTAEVDGQRQSVLGYDRTTGEQLWKTEINSGGFSEIHRNNTHASPTVACDGERIFAVFWNHSKVQLACLDFEGNVVWKKYVGEFVPQYPFGFASSPLLYKDHVLISSESAAGAFFAAFDRKTGEEQWKAERGKHTSYSSPILAEINGKVQVLLSGGKQICSLDPDDGSENWKLDASWVVTCGTLVWSDDMVFASGGFPAGRTYGVKSDGSKILWQNQIKCYEQSLLYHDGYVYAHTDNGIAVCWRGTDGKEMWKERISERGVSASPILVGEKIYMTDEKGNTTVLAANPNKLEKLAQNKLGDESFATPAFVDNRIYTRVSTRDGRVRQGWLYCLGTE